MLLLNEGAIGRQLSNLMEMCMRRIAGQTVFARAVNGTYRRRDEAWGFTYDYRM